MGTDMHRANSMRLCGLIVIFSSRLWGMEPGDHTPLSHWRGQSVAEFKGVSNNPGHPAKPRLKRSGDRDRSDSPRSRYHMDNASRAGRADLVSKWAQPSTTQKYYAGFVGGGAAHGGRNRTSSEGIWGVDYQLLRFKKAFMKWTCGCDQGGEGAYATDHEAPHDR